MDWWFLDTRVQISVGGTLTPVAQSPSPQGKREVYCNLSLHQTTAIFSQSYLKKTVRIFTEHCAFSYYTEKNVLIQKHPCTS